MHVNILFLGFLRPFIYRIWVLAAFDITFASFITSCKGPQTGYGVLEVMEYKLNFRQDIQLNNQEQKKVEFKKGNISIEISA